MAQTPEPRTGDRIAKLLARAGVASRREIERMIADGRVALDGKVLDTPATVLRSLAGVTVDGEPVAQPEPTRLFLYHKPTGLLVTENDPKGRPTIYDRLPDDLPRLVPVGRLDLNTEGLLLLTTDGGFKRQLELPSTGVERSYRARAYGNVTQQQLEELAEGVEIDGIRYGPIDANIERRTGANVWIEVTITEGKNREVRRVLEHLELQVSRLIRTRYGPFILGDLPVGGVGEVKQHEVVAFRRTLKGGAPDEPMIEAPRDGFRTAPTANRPARARPRAVEAPAPREAQERPASARTPATGEGRRAPRRSDAAPAGVAPRPARPGATPASSAGGRQDARRGAPRADRGGDRTGPQDGRRFAPRADRGDERDAPRQDGRRFAPRADRGDERETGRGRFGDARRAARTADAKPAGARPPRSSTRPPRDDERPAKVPTGGSAIKPWEKGDDRSAGRARSNEGQRSGGTGGRPARTGARPPRGDAPRSGGPAGGRGSPRPKPSGGAPRGTPKGGRR
ncbi:MAG: pseudouridine synthase [Sphingomonas sp.]|nr:MAG: pseudouridine synthase [Sphingomonas sp.]